MNLDHTKIKELYSNKIGMTFFWENTQEGHPYHNRINIIIDNTGLHLDNTELDVFLKDIENALERPINCGGEDPKNCKSMLLETPMTQLSFAMSFNNLIDMKDLITGTLFELSLSKILKEMLD